MESQPKKPNARITVDVPNRQLTLVPDFHPAKVSSYLERSRVRGKFVASYHADAIAAAFQTSTKFAWWGPVEDLNVAAKWVL